MKVRVYPADQWGCGHYRLIFAGKALAAQGYDVTVIMPGTGSGIGGVVFDSRVWAIEFEADADADVFVFQRPTNIMAVDLIRLLRRRGKAVVVDMDDDLTRIHPNNAAFRLLHPKWSPNNNWNLAIDGCKLANLVTLSTPALQQRYAKYGASRVLRNCIPARFLDVNHEHTDPPVWGWAGSLPSHPDDVPILGPTVNQLTRQGYEFQVLGTATGTGKALGMSADPGGPGHVPFLEWPNELTKLAVGVAPLNDTEFNRSKSWLKPLEYAAVGVPFVASNQAEYALLTKQNPAAGRVVQNRSRHWTATVRELLADEQLRQEASEAARALAAQFTIEEHAWRWMETWEKAYELNQPKPKALSNLQEH